MFEGLDAAGKTTALERIEDAQYSPKHGEPLFTGQPVFTHQPSGAPGIGGEIYRMTENAPDLSPVSRQFLHLAAHAQHYQDEIWPALGKGESVWMDRCWWSTVAYGRDAFSSMPTAEFVEFARVPAGPYRPTVVFLFMVPWREDPHNTPRVRDMYRRLYSMFSSHTILVPQLSPSETSAFIFDKLIALGIMTGGTS